MVKISTLIYLLDDFKPSDMLLNPIEYTIFKDEHYTSLLNLLEIDPGDEIVTRILEKIEEK